MVLKWTILDCNTSHVKSYKMLWSPLMRRKECTKYFFFTENSLFPILIISLISAESDNTHLIFFWVSEPQVPPIFFVEGPEKVVVPGASNWCKESYMIYLYLIYFNLFKYNGQQKLVKYTILNMCLVLNRVFILSSFSFCPVFTSFVTSHQNECLAHFYHSRIGGS